MPSRPACGRGYVHAEYYANQSRAYGKNQMRYSHWPINDGADTF